MSACYEDNCKDLSDCPVLDLVGEDGKDGEEGEDGAQPGLDPDLFQFASGIDLPCKPGFLTSPGCGIFVSGVQGDDAKGDGSKEHPVASLHFAIEMAKKGRRVIYACAESFFETIVVPPGFVLSGGIDCNGSWQPGGGLTRVVGAPGEVAVTIEAGEPTLINRFSMQSPPATSPGTSSIATFVMEGADVTFRNCEFVADVGAPGQDGGAGVAALAGEDGPDGLAGSAACTGVTPYGGAPALHTCDDGDVSESGAGGDGGPVTGADGTDGTPVLALPGGAGGDGEDLGTSCQNGANGADGKDGKDGLGADGLGFMIPGGGYRGRDGAAGTPGKVGQGGGGGGGGRGSPLVCGGKPSGGPGGGSGGAGGCGGRGGPGGGHGGASIALVMDDASVSIEGSLLRAKGGGAGGNGGPAPEGGSGGLGAPGGNGQSWLGAGCSGGNGGNGGRGGAGGGGLGGPTVIVAYTAREPHLLDTECTAQALGPSGPGGKSGNPLAGRQFHGADGIRRTFHRIPVLRTP